MKLCVSFVSYLLNVLKSFQMVNFLIPKGILLLLNSVIPSHVDTTKMGLVPHAHPTGISRVQGTVTGWPCCSSPWISNGDKLWLLNTVVGRPRMFSLSESVRMPGLARSLSVLGCAHVTSVIYLGDSFKGKGSYLPWLESRRTNVFLSVCGARLCVQSSRRDCPAHS